MKILGRLGFALLAVAFLLLAWTVAIMMMRWVVSAPIKTVASYYGAAGTAIAVVYMGWTVLRDRRKKNRRITYSRNKAA